MIWPLITFCPWIVQKKVRVPAWAGVNCTTLDAPAAIAPLSVTPEIVNVCAEGPAFVTVTVTGSPTRAVKALGE